MGLLNNASAMMRVLVAGLAAAIGFILSAFVATASGQLGLSTVILFIGLGLSVVVILGYAIWAQVADRKLRRGVEFAARDIAAAGAGAANLGPIQVRRRLVHDRPHAPSADAPKTPARVTLTRIGVFNVVLPERSRRVAAPIAPTQRNTRATLYVHPDARAGAVMDDRPGAIAALGVARDNEPYREPKNAQVAGGYVTAAVFSVAGLVAGFAAGVVLTVIVSALA